MVTGYLTFFNIVVSLTYTENRNSTLLTGYKDYNSHLVMTIKIKSMKRLLNVCILIVLSCNETDKIKPFILGSYCKEVTNEFNQGYDTLVISALNENTYQVNRYSSFRRIRKGKKKPTERRTEIWTAFYNNHEQVLHETKKGKVISFFPDKNTLVVGTSEYKKIDN